MVARRLGTALAGLALVAGGLVATPPAYAAGTGTLTVKLVDERGQAVAGALSVIGADGAIVERPDPGSATYRFTLPQGSYAVGVISTWAGLLCDGLDGCDYFAIMTGAARPDGTVRVREGRTTTVVLEGDKPARVTGTPTVGSELRLEWSRGMRGLIDSLGTLSGGALAPRVQWLRNGDPIDGETDLTYRPTAGDVGATIAARIAYAEGLQDQVETIAGAPADPRTVRGVEIRKVRTRAFTGLADPTVPAGRQGKVRVDVTAADAIVTGRVRVEVGGWSKVVALRNGGARVLLPVLPRGRHTVAASYLGSAVYAPSKAKPKQLTIG